MGVNVTIKIATLATLQDNPLASVPTARLTEYFEAIGVGLLFQGGEILASCPCLDSRTMAAFCAERAPPQGSFSSPAYLVVSGMDREGLAVHGQLMDPLRRGACVVYIGSSAFSDFGQEERFEIFVHELGHLLNLTHKCPVEDFPTAMLQWDDRRPAAGKRGAIWDEAIRIARPRVGSRLGAFFGQGETRPVGIPMSGQACHFLENGSPSAILPWGDEFGDKSTGALNDGTRTKGVICKVEIENTSLQVAQAIDFSVSLELAPNTMLWDVPLVLDTPSGNVQVELEADGAVRVLQPYSRSCTSLLRRLKAPQKARRNFSILGDYDAVALPRPGTYRLRVVMPRLGVHSEWQVLEVAAGPKLLSHPAMQDFLRRGLPGGEQDSWRAVGELLDDKSLSPAFSSHLALMASASNLRPLKFETGTAGQGSKRIAEEAALLRVEMLKASSTSSSSDINNAIDDAVEIFAQCDSQHPTLGYLRYLRSAT